MTAQERIRSINDIPQITLITEGIIKKKPGQHTHKHLATCLNENETSSQCHPISRARLDDSLLFFIRPLIIHAGCRAANYDLSLPVYRATAAGRGEPLRPSLINVALFPI